jgi:hypothetical protein
VRGDSLVVQLLELGLDPGDLGLQAGLVEGGRDVNRTDGVLGGLCRGLDRGFEVRVVQVGRYVNRAGLRTRGGPVDVVLQVVDVELDLDGDVVDLFELTPQVLLVDVDLDDLGGLISGLMDFLPARC